MLVRHAPFLPRPGGPGDRERSLTDEGRGQAQRLVAVLAAAAPTAIVSSPYLRAVRTVDRLAPSHRPARCHGPRVA
ncbi:histidine phosphatase family protein [Nocardia beijingensis]|uniref:histidine phosphatase family protein n=1 Tax=Nocardia beijingensis TaxID=95162 RepID=UPI001894297A|nr:histidine phosphatase family protein [Nocardia beijingensis]